MKETPEFKFRVTMLTTTADRWISDVFKKRVAPHELGADYWQYDDEDEHKAVFTWPSDHLTAAQFFSLVSAMFSRGDQIYTGCDFAIYLESSNANASVSISKKAYAEMRIDDKKVAADLSERIHRARKVLDINATACPSEL